MNTKYFSSYQHYNSSGLRLSLFGHVIYDHLEIVIFTCQKKDQFVKKIAREAFEKWLEGSRDFHDGRSYVKTDVEEFHPWRIRKKLVESVTPRSLFIATCNREFSKIKYHYTDVPGIPLEMKIENKYGYPLTKRGKGVIIKYLGK